MPINFFENYPMSWKPDKAILKRPFYLSVARALMHDIFVGILLPGTKLPPQRELADFLDLNFTTITRAYKVCERKGFLYAIRGSGTFVSLNATRSITISTEQFTGNCIELGFVASFEECNSLFTKQIQEFFRKRHLEQFMDYDTPTGMLHQKTAALAWMKPFGIDTDNNHIAIVSGAQNALVITLLALFEPGSRIAVDTYTFSNFIELAKMFHLQLVSIPGDNEGMLAEALEVQCRLNQISGVFLMPSCCNPTGITISPERKRKLANVIKRYALIIIEDDIQAFLIDDKEHYKPFFSLVPEQTVYICSTSKSICSGLRVAYMAFPEVFREKILRAIFNVNVKTSSLTSEIITDLIVSGKAQEIVLYKKTLSREANRLFQRYFPNALSEGHPLSFYRWLPIEPVKNAVAFEEHLLTKGIRVFHSSRFLSSAVDEKQFLRIALSSSNSLTRLEKGLQILKNSL